MQKNFVKLNSLTTVEEANRLFFKEKNLLEFVVGIYFDKYKNVVGILTLGDLRRAIYTGKKKDNISKYINRKFFYINHETPESEYNNKLNEFFRKKKISDNAPILILKDRKLKKLISIDSLKNNIKYKTVCVIGLGHVGLPLSVYIANNNLKTVGHDKDKRKLETLKKTKVFVEKDLEDLKKKVFKNKKLLVESDFKKIKAQIYIVCVGAELINNKVTSKNLNLVIKSLSKVINLNDLIILRGTMLVEQTRLFMNLLNKKTKMIAGKDYYLSYCPERLVEGNALEELKKLPQIVSGASINCQDMSIKFWNSLMINTIKGENFEEAEIIKLASNSYRDLIFSFSNDLCKISSKYNIDINELIDKANIGYERNDFKKPSPGVGGSCLVKDPLMFSINDNNNGYRLGRISRKINSDAINLLLKRVNIIKSKFNIDKMKILIFGLTYKGNPETSDIRSSMSLKLAEKLKKNNIDYKFYDITLKKYKMLPKHLKSKFILKESKFKEFDMIILMNNHINTEEVLIKNLKISKKPKFLYDCWNIIQKEKVEFFNYKYISLSKLYF